VFAVMPALGAFGYSVGRLSPIATLATIEKQSPISAVVGFAVASNEDTR
jgi:hypothetical protein